MQQGRRDSLFALSVFWFAWEVQWAALLGAALQGQIARFFSPQHFGTATAVLLGSGAALSILSQYRSGRISDQRGNHKLLIAAGTLVNIGGLFGFALAPAFLPVLISFAVIQIAFNAAGGPYQALMPTRVDIGARSRASAVMGLFRLSGNAAGLFMAKLFVRQPGPQVSGAMFTAGLLHLVETIAAVLLVALAITLLGVRRSPAHVIPQTSSDAWPAKTSFTWLILSRSAVSMGLYLIIPFFAFYLRFAQHVADYIHLSLNLLLIMTGCALIGTVPAGIAGDRIPKKRILYGALGLLTLGAIALSVVANIRAILPLAIALGVGWGAYYSVDWALACVMLPQGRAGALMAIWNIGSSAPQVAAPIVGGLLVDRVAAMSGDLALGYRWLFALIALCVVAGGIALAFVRENWAGTSQQPG